MNIAKAVFSALTVIFALLGVTNILDYDVYLLRPGNAYECQGALRKG